MEKKKIRNLLRDLEMARKKILRPQFLELGLTVGQGQPSILANLLRHGPQTQKKLSDRCHWMSPPCPGRWTEWKRRDLWPGTDNPTAAALPDPADTPGGGEGPPGAGDLCRLRQPAPGALREEEAVTLHPEKLADGLSGE